MINPYLTTEIQSTCTKEQRDQILAQAQGMPKVLLSSMGLANLVMMNSGYFSPITHMMNQEESLSVAEKMRCLGGSFWPVPIINLVAEKPEQAQSIALLDPHRDGQPIIGVQEVKAVEQVDERFLGRVAAGTFGTTSREHPGVDRLYQQGRYLVSGPVQGFDYSYFAEDFPSTFLTAGQIRQEINRRGWKKVVAFQTRNPMHRAHEELCKMALHDLEADGLVIHMLLGKLKAGDIPADVRDESIRVMVEKYFAPDSVLVCGYGFDMLYAGPREALLHAIFRQNMGADALIVGRDHAGVGKWYSPFGAQEIFAQVPPDALAIDIYKADHTAWSKKLNRVVMMRDVPDHKPEDFILLSGTKVREMLAAGADLPEEFSRPEVAEILRRHYLANA